MSLATERPLLVTFGSRGDVQRRFLCAHPDSAQEPGSCRPGWDGCQACGGAGQVPVLSYLDGAWLAESCTSCQGAGGWRVCPASVRHCRAAAAEAERC
jgi:hypothetical protein